MIDFQIYFSIAIPLSLRAMTTRRNINFGFLEKEGLEIGRTIKSLGWEFLCTLNRSTYSHLVRESYGNNKVGVNTIESKVKGIKIA